MNNSRKAILYIAMFIIAFYLLLPCLSFADSRNLQKAIDAMYNITRKYSDKLSSVFNEKARTTEGQELPCHIFEVSQYEQNFAIFGPPMALSTAISFSKSDEEYSGIYITIYVLNSNSKTTNFLKMMSEDWIVSTTFHNLPALEVKTSDQVSNFFFICGRYIFREELFNASSIREDMYAAAATLGLNQDNEYIVSTQPADTDIQPAETEEQSVEPETAEIVEDLNESDAKTTTEEEAAETAETSDQSETEIKPEEETTETVEAPAQEGVENETVHQEAEIQPTTVEQPPVLPVTPSSIQTPYENWMNSWKIISSFYKTRYVYENINIASAPPGGGYKMIVLKPKDNLNPAILEGRFKPKTYQSELYLRMASIRNADASALLAVEVNGYPIIKDKRISGTDGWQEMNINIGAMNPSFCVILIKVYPDPYGKAGLDTVFIDDISVDGSPVFNNKLTITTEKAVSETGEKPLLNIQGLWTDLRNFSYTVRQKGNTFTFSCTEKLNDYLWEVSGEGMIKDGGKLSITFTEKYRPLGKIVKSTATGIYDKSKKIVEWNSQNERFPGEWLFIK